MPLCPSCIGEHTMYHEQTGSKPQYHNIYETLSETQTLLYNSIYALEVDKKRIVKIHPFRANSWPEYIQLRI